MKIKVIGANIISNRVDGITAVIYQIIINDINETWVFLLE